MTRSSFFLGWTSWGVAALYYLFETILRVATGVMVDDLRSSFGLISTQMGFLASAYYYAYTPLQVPCGLILDRIGVRKLLTASSLLCVGGTYLFSISPDVIFAYVGRFLIGAGSACAFISCLKLVSGWFPENRFALMAGLTNMMGCLGGVFAGEPIARHISAIGWRQTMEQMAIIGIFVSILCWYLIKDPIPSHPIETKKESVGHSFFVVIKKSQIWISGLIGGLMYVPVSVFAELWATPFLATTYHLSKERASLASMLLFIGMGMGGPVMGYYAQRMNHYRQTLILTILVIGGLFFAIAAGDFFSFSHILCFSALSGFFMGGQVLVFTLSQFQVDKKDSGTASAFTNSLVMFVGLICQPLLGMILDFFWTGGVNAQGLRMYSAETYRYAILTLPLCFVIALILMRFLKEPSSTT